MPSKRLVIAIDCDDVLIATARHIIDDYNRKYGTRLNLGHMYKPASIETWGTDEDDVAIERVNEFLRSDEHARLAPDPKAVIAIKQLALQHELHLITGRVNFLEAVTKNMLEEYFKDCFQSVEHTNYVIPSTSKAIRRSKGDVCIAIGADILIDDHLEHANNALATKLKKVIVFGNYPWNQQEQLPEGMVRCVDWTAVIEEIDSGR
jgi:5'(3')-deoxyribonucleotidase